MGHSDWSSPETIDEGDAEIETVMGLANAPDEGMITGGTSTPAIYQSERWGQGTLSYAFPLTNGEYTVVEYIYRDWAVARYFNSIARSPLEPFSSMQRTVLGPP